MSGLSGSNPFTDDRPLFEYEKDRANGSFDGLNYFGPPLNIKSDDPEANLPTPKVKAHVRQFNLSQKIDMELYEKVCQAAWEGDVAISYEKIEYDQTINSWRVLLRWAEKYCAAPKNTAT